MLPDIKAIRDIAFKELNLFFASPIGYLFLGVFVTVTLFTFFWGHSFFARNIADVRPMFEMMPVFLIFLCAALTMRMWSEERRSGTLEHVMTLPVDAWQFIWGKFAACKTLLFIALLLTLPLPITVSLLADLDWGPVVSAYIATMFLGTAYLAIGLYVSSRSDNQIVSLILTVIVCGAFYFIGSETITSLVSNQTGEVFRALGSGSRFESITRGVLDLRDFYYYISIVLVFLILNRYALEKDRWHSQGESGSHHKWRTLIAVLVANVLVANFWLAPLGSLRFDTTEGKIYSISDATENYLNQLREPLLIHGYFSAKTHPLLAPLVPEVQDLLKEYQETGKGNVRVEFIDPAKDAEAEEEAGSKYGIRPTPFRIADRYQSAVVNSYFNLLVQYGDEYKVLGFDDLIEVNASANGMDVDVKLRNPEYDITNAIKQVLYAYQSGGSLFSTLNQPVEFTGYISAAQRLPESLAQFTETLEKSLKEMQTEAGDKLSWSIVDPSANGGAIAQQIEENYGFRPMASSLFDTNTFYYYLVVSSGDLAVQIPIPEDLSQDAFGRSMDAALKRFSAGFTKTIGVVAPQANPYAQQMGQSSASFSGMQQVINENMTAKPVTLNEGKVPDEVDLLMVMAPENLDEKAVFAIDQFLMKGGTVVLASSPLKAELSQAGLTAKQINSGLDAWLAHHGLTIKPTFVMDEANTPFPVPVQRQVGMFSVREMMMVDYPYFLDLRNERLNGNNPITSSLPELTMPWVSPLSIDAEKNAQRQVIELAHSSDAAWLSSSTEITPKVDSQGKGIFASGETQGEQLLAAVVKGRFSSYFAGKESPLLKVEGEDAAETEETADAATDEPEEVISSVIEKSSEAASIILIGSNSFAEDRTMSMTGSSGMGDAAPAQLLVNAAEWSLEDTGLLSIRSRGHFNRTLPPMDDSSKQTWETLNYVFAFIGLILVFVVRTVLKRRSVRRYQLLLQSI